MKRLTQKANIVTSSLYKNRFAESKEKSNQSQKQRRPISRPANMRTYTFDGMAWRGRDTHADHGIGFIVDEQHSQAIVEIRPINLSLIHMKIQAKNTVENYIQCYAPLNTDDEDVKDELFENLHDTLPDIPSSEQIYLTGDFNGKVGNESRMYT